MNWSINGLFLQSSEETITNPLITQENSSGMDLVERHPIRIKRSVANYRYVYHNDPTVRGILLNNMTTANNKFMIESTDTRSQEHIELKVKEWDLDNVMNQTLLKVMRDGQCFIEKAIVDGSIQVRFLAFDNDKYQFKVIRDPQSGKILGYKQKVRTTEPIKNWEGKKFDKLENKEKEEEYNYKPEDIICPVLIGESGQAESLVGVVLDVVDAKWTLEKFMLSAAHKAGNLIGVTIGNENTPMDEINPQFAEKVVKLFKKPIEKDVVSMPHGVEAQVLGNGQLPDLQVYLKYLRNEIFLALQTPESLFSTESSNRSTAEVQTDDKTGYAVFIGFLRDFLKKYFERDLIDAELTLKHMKGVGNTQIVFDEDKNPQPLKLNTNNEYEEEKNDE